MFKEVDYQVAWSASLSGLENEVSNLIQDGWQCKGGLSIDHDGRYIQAMVLLEEIVHYEEVRIEGDITVDGDIIDYNSANFNRC